MEFKQAVKRDAKLRLAIAGPGGSGKTYTLLKLATELGGKIALVDTEHGSASKYAHTDRCGGLEDPAKCADPSHFTFDVIEPTSFDPHELMQYINKAVERGYNVFLGDSLSHYWMGVGGELEMVDNAAKQNKGNSFAGWKTVTPIHNKLVNLMLSAPIHVLVSMRVKTEWVIEKDDKGKMVPRKIGLQPVMRDGIEYEFDVCGDMDQDNTLTITKSRCSALAGKCINRPGAEMAETLKTWLGSPDALRPVEPKPAPAEIVIPGPMRGVIEKLGQPGNVKAALEEMRNKLKDASPKGEDEYKRIVELHGLKKGPKIAEVTAALIEMWSSLEFALAAGTETTSGFKATDEDLPEDLFSQPEVAHS